MPPNGTFQALNPVYIQYVARFGFFDREIDSYDLRQQQLAATLGLRNIQLEIARPEK